MRQKQFVYEHFLFSLVESHYSCLGGDFIFSCFSHPKFYVFVIFCMKVIICFVSILCKAV